MSSWGDEVYAAVDSGVWDPFLPVDIDFLLQVRLVLIINELHDGLPAMPWWRKIIEEGEGEKREGERRVRGWKRKRRDRSVKGGRGGAQGDKEEEEGQ